MVQPLEELRLQASHIIRKRDAGRFAPTPTGSLHVGNAYTALLSWLASRSSGFHEILRMDDLDPKATPKGCVEQQIDDLNWLGLSYDEGPKIGGDAGPYFQGQRAQYYRTGLEYLNQRKLLYPCYCTRKELATLAPHASDEGVIYPEICKPSSPSILNLDELPTKSGRLPSIRLNVTQGLKILNREDKVVQRWRDKVAGDVTIDLINQVGDFIVQRKDGVSAYQLACAIDDWTQGCTLVLRGNDLLPSTARQQLLLELFDAPTIHYAHVPLVLDINGERLAKRRLSTQLRGLREQGISPTKFRKSLSIAWGGPPTGNLDELLDSFSWASMPRQPIRWGQMQSSE